MLCLKGVEQDAGRVVEQSGCGVGDGGLGIVGELWVMGGGAEGGCELCRGWGAPSTVECAGGSLFT